MEIGLVIGLIISALIIGATFGVFVMCLMVVASRADDGIRD